MLDHRKLRARRSLDRRFARLAPLRDFAVPQGGWLRAIREALGMTGEQMAARLGITPPSLSALEQSEKRGTIRLSTLRRAAEALDCTLVYALVPRRPLEETVRERARKLALRDLGTVDRTMQLEDQAVEESLDERIEDYIRQSLRDADLWKEP